MPLKTTGKRRVPRLRDLAEEGDEDAKALMAEGAEKGVTEKKPANPPSIGLTKVKAHINLILARREAWELDTEEQAAREGRPTKYTPHHDQLAVEIMTGDVYMPFGMVAVLLGIGDATFDRWRQKHPSFDAAIKSGLRWQEMNMSNIMIYDRINVAGAIMTMKNSAHRWKDKVEHDIGDNIAGLIRKAEENRRVVDWTDIGGYGVSQKKELPKRGDGVIEVSVTEEPAKEPERDGGDDNE